MLQRLVATIKKITKCCGSDCQRANALLVHKSGRFVSSSPSLHHYQLTLRQQETTYNMFARTGINTLRASVRTSQVMTQALRTAPTFTSAMSTVTRTTIVRRTFSSSKPTAANHTPVPEPTRVPRPIPMDIGNSPSAANFFQSSASSSTASASEASSATSRKFRSYASGGSVFDRYGGPVLNIIIYSTAATLLLHLAYHHLALEEYKISSNRKLKDLEEEISTLKAQRVQHALGGRGEFV